MQVRSSGSSQESLSSGVPRAQNFRGHIAEIDALRAIGILAVVAAHTFPPSLFWSISQMLYLSWIFMDWFFVASGFLITGILLDSKERPGYLKNFYIRRSLRILPLYYLVIVGVTIAIYVSGSHMPDWGSPWWFFFYLGTVPTAVTGTLPSALGYSLGPLWSLQIEEQFYLLFPLLVHFTKTATLKRVLAAMIVFSMVLRVLLYALWPENQFIQYVLLPCRLDGLALGALIAIRYRSGPWNIHKGTLTALALGWLSLAVAIGVYDGYAHTGPLIRTIGFFVSSVASAYVTIWMIELRGSSFTKLLRIKPMQHIGDISYGMYLFHMPIAALVAVALAPYFGELGPASVPTFLLVLPITIVLASLSRAYFEVPIQALRDRWTAKPKQGPAPHAANVDRRRAVKLVGVERRLLNRAEPVNTGSPE